MTQQLRFRNRLLPEGSPYLRNTNLDFWVWLTGRGMSIACGFGWEPLSLQVTESREERIARIGMEMEHARAMCSVNDAILDELLRKIRERSTDGQRHSFLTLNWDSLFQEAVDRCAPGPRQPRWMESSAVYHLNGSFRGPPDDWSSNVVLPDDPPDARRRSPEFGSALAKLEIADHVIIVGASMRYPIDRALLQILAMEEDKLPIGEADVLVVDREPAEIAGELRKRLPAARVFDVQSEIEAWICDGLPGFEGFRSIG